MGLFEIDGFYFIQHLTLRWIIVRGKKGFCDEEVYGLAAQALHSCREGFEAGDGPGKGQEEQAMTYLTAFKLHRGRDAKQRFARKLPVSAPTRRPARLPSASPSIRSLLTAPEIFRGSRRLLVERYAVPFTDLGWFSPPFIFVFFVVYYGLTQRKRE